MPCHRLVRQIRLSGVLLLALLCGAARAAELGEPVVRSYIGQPLVADIELLAMSPEEGAALQAKVARPDVFRGANIAMSPVLSSLHMSVARRDGRQFLHITSIRPVETDFLHLFIEVGVPGATEVRSALLWLAADPRPAVAQAPVTVASLEAEDAALAAAQARAAAAAHRPAAGGAKAMSSNEALARACAILDAKNVALSAQIVQLEAKVKRLQAQIPMKAAPAVRAEVASAEDGADKGGDAREVKDSKDSKKKTDWSRWYWIGGGSAAGLALIGAGWFVFQRKRAGKGKAKAKAKPAGDEESGEGGESPAAAGAAKPGRLAGLRAAMAARMAGLKQVLSRKKKGKALLGDESSA